jgi:hypothetical protein
LAWEEAVKRRRVEEFQGLKPVSILGLFAARLNWLREKARFQAKCPEKHTAGAKALIDFIGLMPGINPRPTARQGFFRCL